MIEVVFSLAIMTMTLLALVSLCSTCMHVNKKSSTQLIAVRIADSELQRLIQDALTGQNPSFWKQDYPYPTTPIVTNSTTVGSNEFTWAIYANTITSANASTLGAGRANNLLKKTQIVVWWGSSTTREGYGKMSTSICRLVGQGDTP